MQQNKFNVIGMVVAMDKELQPFFEKSTSKIEKYNVSGFDVFYYEISGKKIYVIKSGIGEIYASGATSILLSVYKCELILNFGVVGSLDDDVSVLDAVVVSGIVHYDFDLSKIDNVSVGQYPSYESPIMKCNRDLIDLAISVNSSLKEAVCASADKFVADEDVKDTLNKTYGAKVCDMECAGVLLTANMASVPALIIKAVSDGKGGADEFNRRVKSASKIYIETVNKIISLV